MSRILVVGPFVPSGDPLAMATLGAVRDLRAQGHDVEVLSPEPSAARWHGRLATPAGLVTLARAARGRDRVIVQLRPDCFSVPSGAAAKRAAGAALHLALRDVASVELVPQSHAAGTSPVAALFLGAGAVLRDDPRVRAEVPARVPDEWPAVEGPGAVAAVQAAVRARAAAERSRRALAATGPGTGHATRGLEPLRVSVPVSSPAVTAVRRVLHRLTAWETEPLVTRLNRLSALAAQRHEPGESG